VKNSFREGLINSQFHSKAVFRVILGSNSAGIR
jgi:hypothetical protein